MGNPQYVVMCRVSGGLTGTRQGPLRVGGQVQHFTSREEAQLTALCLNAMPRPYAVATFSYWVEEVDRG